MGLAEQTKQSWKKSDWPALFLGRRVNAYIEDLPVQESEEILDQIWSHTTHPENTWTQEWQVGDLVMWDNRCVMHRRGSLMPTNTDCCIGPNSKVTVLINLSYIKFGSLVDSFA